MRPRRAAMMGQEVIGPPAGSVCGIAIDSRQAGRGGASCHPTPPTRSPHPITPPPSSTHTHTHIDAHGQRLENHWQQVQRQRLKAAPASSRQDAHGMARLPRYRRPTLLHLRQRRSEYQRVVRAGLGHMHQNPIDIDPSPPHPHLLSEGLRPRMEAGHTRPLPGQPGRRAGPAAAPGRQQGSLQRRRH